MDAMNYEHIIHFFRYSEFHPEVQALLKKMQVPPERPPFSVAWINYESTEWSVHLTFKGKYGFIHDYETIGESFVEGYDEAFLEEFTLGYPRGNKCPVGLPNDLQLGDDIDTAKKKMKVRPSETRSVNWGTLVIYNLDTYHIYLRFYEDNKLRELSIRLHETSFIKLRELKKALRLQDKKLHLSNQSELLQLKTQSPVPDWRERMAEGDSLFNENILTSVESLLDSFIANLLAGAAEKKANKVYGAVKKLVVALNKLNEKNEEFIETIEREELADYIHKAVRLTGFEVSEQTDLTEEWREW